MVDSALNYLLSVSMSETRL